MELLVIVIFITVTGAQRSQLKGPENALSVVGSNVTLKCSSPYRNCSGIDWLLYFGVSGAHGQMYIFRDSSGYLHPYDDLYRVDNSSGCDLIVKNVLLKNPGPYCCRLNISGNETRKTAHLVILDTQPRCAINTSLENTVEGDRVLLTCELTYNGTRSQRSMVWEGVDDAPAAVEIGKTISRSYYVVASAPEVPSFTCITSFYGFETNDPGGKPFPGLATNVPNITCATSAIKVLYSVRNVILSPSLSYYSTASVITCTAKGQPLPTCKWQEMGNGTWTDIQNQIDCKFITTSVSSKWYRCVAMNVVRGWSYNATSNEFVVNKTGNDNGSFTDASDRPENSLLTLPIAVGVGVSIVVVLLLIIVICCFVPCCPCYKWRRSGDKDGVAQHQDHEMSPSSLKHAAVDRSNPKTGAPLVGEQESTYAGLGENREISEYASLEQGQKTENREKVKVGEQESTYAGLGEDREISEYASLEQGQKTEAREKVKVLDQESAYASLGEDRDTNEYESLEQSQKSKPKKKSKPYSAL